MMVHSGRLSLEDALSAQAELRAFILDRPIIAADKDDAAIRVVARLCERVLETANDPECVAMLGRIQQLAEMLFSAGKRSRFDHPGQPGTGHIKLRLLILRELISLRIHIARVRALGSAPRGRPAPELRHAREM